MAKETDLDQVLAAVGPRLQALRVRWETTLAELICAPSPGARQPLLDHVTVSR